MEEFLDVVIDTANFEFNPRCFVKTDSGYRSGGKCMPYYDCLMGYMTEIQSLSRKLVISYLRMGQIFCDIHDRELYRTVRRKSEEYLDLFSFAFKVFGYRKSTVYNFMSVYRNCTHADGELKVTPAYEGFSYSALVELSSLPYDQVRIIRPDITVAELKELKGYWKKYSCVEGSWKKELTRLRTLAAEEKAKEKENEKKSSSPALGLLNLISQVNSSETKDKAVLTPDEQFELLESPKTETISPSTTCIAKNKKLTFANDKERKEFISPEKCEKWDLYIEVPQLSLKYYRYDFANGDYLIAEFGNYYEEYSDNPHKPFRYFRLHLQTKDKPEFDCRGIAPTYVVDYLKAHKDEI